MFYSYAACRFLQAAILAGKQSSKEESMFTTPISACFLDGRPNTSGFASLEGVAGSRKIRERINEIFKPFISIKIIWISKT